MNYLTRCLEGKFRSYLDQFPAVAVTGPRQSGKSTLLRYVLKGYQYVTFDDPIVVSQFEEDPRGFMSQYQDRVIFDEAQYVPDLFRYIKMAIDEDRRKGRFVITGSSQFTFIKSIRESLAGRVGLLSLLPFQFNEFPSCEDVIGYYRGSYPEVALDNKINKRDWYASYFDTYLHKDIATLTQIGDLRDFRRLLLSLAAHSSQQLNYTSIASDIGLSVTTVKRWVSVLEASYIIFLVPPFYKNFNKRIIKAPKIYFYDSGLLQYLLEINDSGLLDAGPLAGHLFENFIVSEVKKREVHEVTHHELYYFRASKGVEVDLVIDRGASCDWVEIKNNHTPKPSMVAPMKEFLTDNDQGYLVYRGEPSAFSGDIKAVNFKDFLSKLGKGV